MTPRPPLSRPAILALAAAYLVGGGCGSAGCGGLAPLPGGARFEGERLDDAVNLRLTAGGLAALSASWPRLVEALAPGGTLHLPVPCARQAFDTGLPLIGVQEFYLADQGQADGQGRNDGVCDALDQPADVAVTITGLSLAAVGGKVEATLSLAVNTGTIYFTRPGTILCDITCRLAFDSRAAPSSLTAAVALSIDPRWDRLLAFSIDRFDGTQVCGAAGAPPAPACLDPASLTLGSSAFGGGGLCLPASWGCDVLGFSFIKDALLQLLSPTLQSALQGLLRGQACQPCGAGQPACPRATDGSGLQSTCSAGGQCVEPSGACVPRFLGTEGRLDLQGLLGGLGAPAAAVDLSLVAGSSVQVDTGVSLGTRAGLAPAQVALCVAPFPAPDAGTGPGPDLQAGAPPGLAHDLALSVSGGFLERFLWGAHQSGALCLAVGSGSVGLLTTGTFKTFLPSLGALAGSDGLDAPMLVRLRPAGPPRVTLGEGTLDPATHRPLDPLLTLSLDGLALDVEALVADRMVRLFTLTVDVKLPLGLAFDGCGAITPVLGDLGMLVSNVRAGQSELLAEDPAVLAALVPALVSLAQPALASGLGSLALPQVAGLQLEGLAARGLPAAGGGAPAHLGLYARLAPDGGSCGAGLAPPVQVAVEAVAVPPVEALAAGPGPGPEVLLAVAAPGVQGTPEYSVRVDDGLWSAFAPAAGGRLRVAQPRLLLQGTHRLEVRGRAAEAPAAVSAPAAVAVAIDSQAPEVALNPDPARGLLLVRAADAVTPVAALRYAYRVGGGPAGAFGPPRPLVLAELEAAGGVEVLVQDAAGLVGRAAWRAPTAVLHAGAAPPEPGAAGCTASGGGLTLLAAAALLAARRRR